MAGLYVIVATILICFLGYIYGVIYFAVFNFISKLLPTDWGFLAGHIIAAGVVMAIHVTLYNWKSSRKSPPGGTIVTFSKKKKR